VQTGKCKHELLIVHGDGAWFVAECKECGMTGGRGESPAEAREKFNRRKGAQPGRPASAFAGGGHE